MMWIVCMYREIEFMNLSELHLYWLYIFIQTKPKGILVHVQNVTP
jgi:hypothetical protein